jgi:hypothetical protein
MNGVGREAATSGARTDASGANAARVDFLLLVEAAPVPARRPEDERFGGISPLVPNDCGVSISAITAPSIVLDAAAALDALVEALAAGGVVLVGVVSSPDSSAVARAFWRECSGDGEEVRVAFVSLADRIAASVTAGSAATVVSWRRTRRRVTAVS